MVICHVRKREKDVELRLEGVEVIFVLSLEWRGEWVLFCVVVCAVNRHSLTPYGRHDQLKDRKYNLPNRLR
jgi:hypothetical protein